MYFKSLLDEALDKGERIGSEVLDELMKSKTIHNFVTSKNFVAAATKLIETKDEIKSMIGQQVHAIFDTMDAPTKKELRRISSKLGGLEQIFDWFVGPQKKKPSCVKKTNKKKVVTKRKGAKRQVKHVKRKP